MTAKITQHWVTWSIYIVFSYFKLARVISGLAKTIRILEATTPPKKKENKTVSSVSKGT